MSVLLPDKPVLGLFTTFPVLLSLGILYTLALVATMPTSRNLGTKILAQIAPCIMFTTSLDFFPKPTFPGGCLIYLGLLVAGIAAMLHFNQLAENASTALARARYYWAASTVVLAMAAFCGYAFLQLFLVTEAPLCLKASNISWLICGAALVYTAVMLGRYAYLAFGGLKLAHKP